MLGSLRSLLGGDRGEVRTDGGVKDSPDDDVITNRSDPAEGSTDKGSTPEDGTSSLEPATLLAAFDLPAFVLDVEGRVTAWGPQCEDLIGLQRDDVLGERNLGAIAYEEADKQTLAEKVCRAPRTAHEEFEGVGLAPSEYALLDAETHRVYEDTSTLDDTDLWFIATPLYHQDEFVGVLEIVQDRSESARRRTEIEALFEELVTTIQAFGRGDFSARASFDREDTVLEEDLLEIVDRLNEMGRSIETAVEQINGDVEQLVESVEQTRAAAREIEAEVDEQDEFLREIQTEMENFSANMEQVAASSQQIAAAVDDVRESSEDGLEAVTDASTISTDVLERGDELVETVNRLGDRMNDIEEIVDVIAEVADQTNLLALNANIEAARTEDGDGFAVVADEVKDLADETQSHTEQISDQIEELRTRVRATIDAVEETHDSIQRNAEQVERAATAFERIDEGLDEAASGAEEIADANDDQAATIEEVITSIDETVAHAEDVLAASERITEETEREHQAVTDVADSVNELIND